MVGGKENDMSEWLKLLSQGVFGLLIAVVAAYLSARWAVRRAYLEKWWERKEQAYADIINSLYDLLRYSGLCANQYLIQGHANPTDELEEKYQEACWKIERVTDIGA